MENFRLFHSWKKISFYLLLFLVLLPSTSKALTVYPYISGVAQETKRIVSTDTAQTLEDAGITIPSGTTGALITCESNTIRFALGGAVPTQTGNKLGHVLEAGQSLHLSHGSAVKTFRFISDVNGSAGILQVTLEAW